MPSVPDPFRTPHAFRDEHHGTETRWVGRDPNAAGLRPGDGSQRVLPAGGLQPTRAQGLGATASVNGGGRWCVREMRWMGGG